MRYEVVFMYKEGPQAVTVLLDEEEIQRAKAADLPDLHAKAYAMRRACERVRKGFIGYEIREVALQ